MPKKKCIRCFEEKDVSLFMNIPGITSIHKIVTRLCRKKSHEQLKKETIDELWANYLVCVKHWPESSEVKFHFVLTVERPD